MPDADALLDALDPEQREAAAALRGPVCIVAGAGTGKTRAITHRMAYGVATGVFKPTEVLAVTFTNRAAGEMRGRLRGLGADGVQARTFHSAALRQSRYFWGQVYGGDLPELTASKIPMIVEASRAAGKRFDQTVLRDLASEIEWAKVSNVRPADYPDVARRNRRSVADLSALDVGTVFEAYEQVKLDARRMDMEDVLLMTAAILTEDERVAAQVRRQYRWFVVDEYQDVNPLQATLLDLWLGGRDDLCVVGDPRQTIYSFAGASPELLTGFTRRHPDAQRIELVRNYRSTPQVIAAANAVFKGSRSDGVRLVSQQEAGDPVSYTGYPDEPTEAASVASEIALLHRSGVPYREMAVLFRVNAMSEAFEEALGEQGVPVVLRGVERFFDRAEVRQGITLLRAAAQSGAPVEDLGGEVRAILSSIGFTDEPPASGASRDRWESLQALVTMAADLPTGSSMVDLVQDLERRVATSHAPTAEGVTLATLHSAKGLEWDAVFCVGMHEGMMPLVHATTAAEIEEERRLFYVGITRARKHLMVSWSVSRKKDGRGTRKPTRFLDPLLPDGHPARRTAEEGRQRKVARCRICGELLATKADRTRRRHEDCPADYDEALYEQLRQWRTEQASERKVPAYVVFNDATLQALAESRPTDRGGLARIPGIGAKKLDEYGEELLALLGS